MKKIVGVGFALILCGCASVEMAQYTVTSFAEVPLKNKAKIKIVANGNGLDSIVGSVKDTFKKGGKFSVVDSDADYWFVLSGAGQYVKSAPQKRVSVVEKENASGGSEVFDEASYNMSSAAKCVSVAVYEAKTLAPVYYFEMPIYAGDNAKGAVRDESKFNTAFAKEVVERVSDAFITQQKQVETPIPLEADSNLRRLFVKGGESFAKQGPKAYAPFIQAYKANGNTDIAKICEQLRTKTYEGSDAAKVLGNYYLYLLVKEAFTLDPTVLAKVRNEHLMILESSDAKGIAESVPVALARIEYKLANIGE